MEYLDCSNLSCPMPGIKLKKFIAENKGSDKTLLMITSAEKTLTELPLFCQQQNLTCEVIKNSPNYYEFKITGF